MSEIAGVFHVDHPGKRPVQMLVGFEGRFFLHPSGALLGDGPLVQLVFQPQLEFAPAQFGFFEQVRDEEFGDFFFELFFDKGRGAEDEAQLLDVVQFFLQ
ncbi:hypothetical protein RZS08_66355, partial [Arthrospira platensis SPKY1]|nr:hypothetical protein [Arthrospira platensis SPKY1]